MVRKSTISLRRVPTAVTTGRAGNHYTEQGAQSKRRFFLPGMASATQGEMKVANTIVKAGWGGSGQEEKWFSIY